MVVDGESRVGSGKVPSRVLRHDHVQVHNKFSQVRHLGITRYNKLANSAELVMNLDVVMMKHSGWNFPRSDPSHLTSSALDLISHPTNPSSIVSDDSSPTVIYCPFCLTLEIK